MFSRGNFYNIRTQKKNISNIEPNVFVESTKYFIFNKIN